MNLESAASAWWFSNYWFNFFAWPISSNLKLIKHNNDDIKLHDLNVQLTETWIIVQRKNKNGNQIENCDPIVFWLEY